MHRLRSLLVLSALSVAAVLLLGGSASASAPKLKIADGWADEVTGKVKFHLQLSQVTNRKVTVDWGTADGTDVDANLNAIASTDYTSRTSTVTFKPGQKGRNISVPITDDNIDDYDRWFVVNLTNAKGAKIADAQGLGTIYDDDAEPQLTIVADTTDVDEGSVGTFTLVTYTLSLSQVSNKEVQVALDFGGTATLNTDYTTAAAGVWILNPGETLVHPTMTVDGDSNTPEPDETVVASLSGPANATLGLPDAAVVTIHDYLT